MDRLNGSKYDSVVQQHNAFRGRAEDSKWVHNTLLTSVVQVLLAVPFVLHSQPTAVYEGRGDLLAKMASTAHRRYAEILRDVEELINDHSEYRNS